MARPVTVAIEHSHGVEGAKKRVDERFSDLEASIAGGVGLKFDRQWNGDQLTFSARGLGQRITGEVDIFPQHVRITVVLPNLLAGMAEALKGRVEKDAALLLDGKSTRAD